MTTVIDQIKTRVTAVGGRCWLDELLVRADESDVKGAHVVLQWRAPDAVGGESGGSVGPLPVTVLADDPLWTQVCDSIDLSALQSVNDLAAQVEQLTQQLATAEQARDQAIAAHNALAEQYNALLAQSQQQNGGD